MPLLAIMLATGCGAGSGGSGVGGGGLPTLSGTPSADPLRSTPAPAEASPAPLPTTAEPRQSGTSWVSLPWQLVRLSKDGRRVFLAYVTGGCTSPGFVAVRESARDVVLTAWSQRQSGARPCPAYARIDYGWVRLAAPLGDRALLHAPVTGGA